MTELTCYHAHRIKRPDKCDIASPDCKIESCSIYLNKEKEENRLFHEWEDRFENEPRGGSEHGGFREHEDPGFDHNDPRL